MKINKFYIRHVSAAKQLMDDHRDKHYTADQLAQLIGVGNSQLKKAFKLVYKTGIYAYQLDQRFKYACTLIEEEDLPLKTIARKAGFKQVTNFTTAFKKHFGITPGQWRNKILDGSIISLEFFNPKS